MHFNAPCINEYLSYSAVQMGESPTPNTFLGEVFITKDLQNILRIRYETITRFTHSIKEMNAKIKAGVIEAVMVALID